MKANVYSLGIKKTGRIPSRTRPLVKPCLALFQQDDYVNLKFKTEKIKDKTGTKGWRSGMGKGRDEKMDPHPVLSRDGTAKLDPVPLPIPDQDYALLHSTI